VVLLEPLLVAHRVVQVRAQRVVRVLALAAARLSRPAAVLVPAAEQPEPVVAASR
jgi:hypothetical protein